MLACPTSLSTPIIFIPASTILNANLNRTHVSLNHLCRILSFLHASLYYLKVVSTTSMLAFTCSTLDFYYFHFSIYFFFNARLYYLSYLMQACRPLPRTLRLYTFQYKAPWFYYLMTTSACSMLGSATSTTASTN